MKYKILTRQNQNPPYEKEYQLRWYALGGLMWDIMPVPDSFDKDIMKYPPYVGTTEDWVKDKEMIYKFLELKKEYDSREKPLPKKWKVIHKEVVNE